MTVAFKTFIRALAANSALLRANNTAIPGRLTLVLGNESADLDSMVSSISLAYALSQSTNLVVPVINTNRQDMVLRPECDLLLRHTLSDISALTFIDDIDLAHLANESLDVWLVDHNAPASRQAFLEPFVRGIVDHHIDEGKCLGAQRQIEVVASCATLVAQRLWGLGVMDPDLAKLLIAPILVDSSNLNPAACRATPADIASVQWLSTLVDWAPEQSLASDDDMSLDVSGPDALYSVLDSLKGKVSHLSSYDLLRKDYKQWQVTDGTGKLWTVGISSISFPLKKWIKRDGLLDIEQAVRHWIDKQQLDLALVMTHGKTKEDGVKVYGRQLIVASERDVGKVVDKLRNVDILGLQPFDKTGGVWMFTQSRSESSRKQVFPAVKDVIEQLDY
ncbi:Exopolyphosphatase [Coemansia aciculifera]|nr:Exopolyphosphatase [Coemansia aciculifera]